MTFPPTPHARTTHDAIVFDLDGTLWDAAAASTYGWNLALAEMGLSLRVDDDGIRSVSGNPFPRCVEILLPELSPVPESTLRLVEDYERVGIEALAGVLYEGVAEGLRELAAAYPLFLVSNCPDWYAEAFFRVTGLAECFTGWDCHGSSGVGKSRMLLSMRQRYHLANAVYVGDTQGDLHAAREADMEFVFVRYGFGSAVPSSHAFDTFGELVAHFLG
jgi:phosphoglycolate phosphatase